ncbi:MBL fold metallo-hydrolase [Aestuariimicrobium ganziense]|uniref:MBL fold metallo-hydrolase n=1 Tax=Aestuariimicrobium ganziense TaxID=2773677 RepID=UPI00194403B9|nr:MBL fold metallo-hydrolase [Aestuariimicrobium ganziense]
MELRTSPGGQVMAPESIPMSDEAFGPSEHTTITWLGFAGFLVNSRGTTFMIDPLLEGFDMPVLLDFPVAASAVPRLHAVLVGDVTVTLTPADHAWQNAFPGTDEHWHEPDDACGIWIETPDGTIWAPGDSRLIPEHHLEGPSPDVMLFDFSDSEWHFTFDGAVQMANAHPEAVLLCHHWGSVDAPDFNPFNGDPRTLLEVVDNPERIVVLAPGEPYRMTAR